MLFVPVYSNIFHIKKITLCSCVCKLIQSQRLPGAIHFIQQNVCVCNTPKKDFYIHLFRATPTKTIFKYFHIPGLKKKKEKKVHILMYTVPVDIILVHTLMHMCVRRPKV